MIAYIIKSGLCLALVLLVYKVLLERERMYEFNRYFLLFGLCFAFVVPFITMETTIEIPFSESATAVNFENINVAASETTTIENIQEAPALPTWILVTFGLYAIGYILFFFRFIRNIYRIFYKILKSVKVRYKLASLVLLKENVLPHTFLHYIFLKKEAYDTESIAEELYTHELAHVTQKHTLDIILIELIQIVFWFNPLLIYYKKAIQLNHEFLADDAVLKSNIQVPTYQQLLLANAHGSHNLYLASNLNFSVTKKRLQMMTKHTTRGRAWLMASLTIPILTAALFLFSTKVIAQKTTTNAVKNISYQTTEKATTQKDSKADYYKNVTFVFEDAQGEKTKKSYAELTAEEKARLIPPPPKPIAKKPTQQQLNDWLNKEKFALWLDEKVVDNQEITKHEIVHFWQSFVHKNARSKRFPQLYQTHLYTENGFQVMRSNSGNPLGEGVIMHIKAGDRQVRMSKNKVGSTKANSAQKTLNESNKRSSFGTTNTTKGPNVDEASYYNASQKNTKEKDITILINKDNKFLVNENYVVPDLKKLDKIIKSELAKVKHKKTKTASIVSDASVSKDFVLKTITILNNHNIYDITLKTSGSSEEIRLPPPPPAPKKIQVKEIAPPPPPPPAPVPSEGEIEDLNRMHKIMRGGKMEVIKIDGNKYYRVVKRGRKYIFNENAKLVDDKGNVLPPPPPRAKVKNKAKAKNKNKAKAKVKVKSKDKTLKEVIPQKSQKEKQ